MLSTLASSEALGGKTQVVSLDSLAIDRMNDGDRERCLLQWTTARCGDDGAAFTFDEGWEVITKFGLNVLSEMLKDFLLNSDGGERKDR